METSENLIVKKKKMFYQNITGHINKTLIYTYQPLHGL